MPDREKQKEEAEERSAPPGSVVYEAICREGEDELSRATQALAWSGLAAGLSMGFSLVAQGLLHARLPDSDWRPLLVSLGYSVGFLIVVLGRQQLFTENTLTVILPLLILKDKETLRNVARLWTTVLLANLAGAFLFAMTVARTTMFDPNILQAFTHIAEEALRGGFWTTMLRGIFAGWLIAIMVWLLPFAESARVWVIIIITWVLGAGGLSHVIAGSVDVMFLAARGVIPWTEAFGNYTIPSLIGNIAGGVTLVAVLNHAQVVAGTEESADA
jgi:formate/nitrite transporter FocA (FNT family)